MTFSPPVSLSSSALSHLHLAVVDQIWAALLLGILCLLAEVVSIGQSDSIWECDRGLGISVLVVVAFVGFTTLSILVFPAWDHCLGEGINVAPDIVL